MGVCSSQTSIGGLEVNKEVLSNNRKIEKQYARNQQKDQKIKKLLLLGTGESGKSTIFRQLTELYGEGFDKDARIEFTAMIFSNTIIAMKTLVKNAKKREHELSPDSEKAAEEIKEMKDDLLMNVDVAQNVTTLWSDEAIRRTFDERSHFQCTDAAPYFFERVNEYAKPGYIPTLEDIFNVRVKTTGIVERMFSIEGSGFKMIDVGGQRNERKKWIHCFENVTAILFVTAISEYDQTLVEDNKTNRMLESLNLFEEICNSRWFKDISVILFLNKKDLFETKIKTVSISDYFPEYEGPANDFNAGMEWIRDSFEAKCNKQKLESIYCHLTCATDTNNIRHVFNDVKDTVIRQSLCESGLLDSSDFA